MTMGNPAGPSPRDEQRPRAAERRGGSSILALLDTIPAPRALAAFLDTDSVTAGYRTHEIGVPVERALAGSMAAIRVARSGNAEPDSDAAEWAQLETLTRDRGVAVRAYLELFSHLIQDRRREAFWIKTFRRGVASAHVSAFLHGQGGKPGPSNRAFAAGLLHDIGAPALASVVPKSYGRVIEDTGRTGKPLCEVERALLGTDHAAAGAHLLMRWGACGALRDCARLHHLSWHTLSLGREEATLERLVNVADSIVGLADGAGVPSEAESRWLTGGNLPGVSAEGINEATEFARTKLSELPPPGSLAPGAGFVRTYEPNGFGRSDGDGGSVAPVREHPAEPQARANWEQAPRRLLQSAPGFCFTRDVCKAAAGHMVHATGLASCVVVVEDFSRGVRSGASAAIGQPGQAFCTSLDHACRGVGHSPFNRRSTHWEAVGGAGVASARDEHVRIWHRCGLEPPVKPLWIRPWVWAEDLHVLAIFEAGCQSIETYEARLVPDNAYANVLEAIVRLVARQEEEQQRLDTVLDAARATAQHARGEVWSRSVSMIGEVAAGAAHEINNPLAVISGRAQIELARSENPQLSKSLQSIVEQANRTSGIIMGLVEFAKPAKPNPALHRFEELLVPALQHWQARSRLPEHQVHVGFFDPELTVLVDRDHFFQIIVALLENAVSAMDPKSAALHINSPSRPSDEQIRIVIEDNGVGMDARVLAHAMAPFFSNRTAGRGRGFGLSRACRLAEVNGGKVWLESSPNVGTRAIVALPSR